jgi:hypothetical protein
MQLQRFFLTNYDVFHEIKTILNFSLKDFKGYVFAFLWGGDHF